MVDTNCSGYGSAVSRRMGGCGGGGINVAFAHLLKNHKRPTAYGAKIDRDIESDIPTQYHNKGS